MLVRRAKAWPPPAIGTASTRNALSAAKRSTILETLDSERFADLAPPQVHAQLLDDGVYLCSVSTMYRILRANGEVRIDKRGARAHSEIPIGAVVQITGTAIPLSLKRLLLDLAVS